MRAASCFRFDWDDKTLCVYPGCSSCATYASLFSRPTYCSKHAVLRDYLGDPLHILFPSEISYPCCTEPDYTCPALFAPNDSCDNYPTYCATHTDVDSTHQIDHLAQPCISCAKLAILNLRDHACAYCAQQISHSREAQFNKILTGAGLQPTMTNNIPPQLRALKLRCRPDFIFEADHTVLFIEIDEHQHNHALRDIFELTLQDLQDSQKFDMHAAYNKTYTKMSELARMTNIARAYREQSDANSHPRPVVFLRVNPDQFRSGRHGRGDPLTPTFDAWGPRLIHFIKHVLAQPITNTWAIAFARYSGQRDDGIDILRVGDDKIVMEPYALPLDLQSKANRARHQYYERTNPQHVARRKPRLAAQPKMCPVAQPKTRPKMPRVLPTYPIMGNDLSGSIAKIIAQLDAEKAGFESRVQNTRRKRDAVIDGRTRNMIIADQERAKAAQIIIDAFSKAPDGQLKTDSVEYGALCEQMWHTLSSKSGLCVKRMTSKTAIQKIMAYFGRDIVQIGKSARNADGRLCVVTLEIS